MPTGHQAGMGLNVVLSYEKVRSSSRLTGFQAAYSDGEWEIVVNSEKESIINALKDNKTYAWIQKELGVSPNKIKKIKEQAQGQGLLPADGKTEKEEK
jgi:acylphosphatase